MWAKLSFNSLVDPILYDLNVVEKIRSKFFDEQLNVLRLPNYLPFSFFVVGKFEDRRGRYE